MQPILKKKDKSDRKLPQMLHYNYVQCHKVIVTYTGNFGREIEIIKRREKERGSGWKLIKSGIKPKFTDSRISMNPRQDKDKETQR